MCYACLKYFTLAFVLNLGAFVCQAAQPCQDSATEQEIVELLKQPDAKLTLTPASFIRLQPEIRKAFGQRLSVCPQIPLNAKGRPYTKLKLDFPDIWDAFEIAVNGSDWEQAQFIADCVQANPLPSEGLVSLLTIPVWSRDSCEKTAKMLGIPVTKDEWSFCLLDAFQAFGGKAAQLADIVWANNAMDLQQARTRAEVLKKSAIFSLYSGESQKDAEASLSRLGVNFINARNYLR